MMDITNAGHMGQVLTQMDRYGQLARVGGQTGQTRGTALSRKDTVSVSEEAVLRTEAYRTAMNTPDVSQEKIADLKARIANGTYQAEPLRIAVNLLRQEDELYS